MHGKALFENLSEYPLPRRTGVRDYIFHLVPKDDAKMYGITARAFLRKYYKNHATHEVSSLEGIIDFLYSGVTPFIEFREFGRRPRMSHERLGVGIWAT